MKDWIKNKILIRRLTLSWANWSECFVRFAVALLTPRFFCWIFCALISYEKSYSNRLIAWVRASTDMTWRAMFWKPVVTCTIITYWLFCISHYIYMAFWIAKHIIGTTTWHNTITRILDLVYKSSIWLPLIDNIFHHPNVPLFVYYCRLSSVIFQ